MIIIPIIWITVAEALCERITCNLKLRDPVVLVGRHRRKFRLREDESSEVFRLGCVLRPLVDVDDVEARLVAVHGIQYDLKEERKTTSRRKMHFIFPL